MANGILKVGEITTSSGSGNITIGSGVTLNSNTPAFEVYLNGDQTLSDNTETKVAFNATTFDTDSAFDISTNYRFTVPSGKAGKYCFYCALNGTALAVTALQQFKVIFRKNGSTAAGDERASYHYPMNSAGAQESIGMTGTFDLSVADYIEVYALIDDSSGSPALDSYTSTNTQMCYFGGYRLGA
jgi:hypothetical protein